MPLLLPLALLLLAAPAAASARPSWRPPVADLAVIGRFPLLPERSFAARRRRGIDAAPLRSAAVRRVPVSTLAWVGAVLLATGLSVHWAVWRALPPRQRASAAHDPSHTSE